jgi:AcrR family transcriptional regulator
VNEVEPDSLRRLPAGVHGIPRELVERNQRERLIAAMAEVCAERGYAATSIADISRQAAVSTASFYKQFADKRECMLASFEELFGRLLDEAERACEGEAAPAAKARAAIETAAALLGADLPSARLLTVEVLAAGEEGVRLQHAAIERLAERLQTEWGVVAAMVALVARRVVKGEKPSARELREAASVKL